MSRLIKKRYRLVWQGLLLFLIITLSGCWNLGASKRTNQFEETLDQYRLLIRWSKFERALNYINMREGEPVAFDADFYKNIRVTRYEVVDEVAFGKDIDDPREIHIVVAIEFLHEDGITLKSMRYEQVWWYNEIAEGWFLDSNLPDFHTPSKK